MRGCRLVCAPLLALAVACSPPIGTVRLLISDGASAPTTARVEVLGADGTEHVAVDALPVAIECLLAPLPTWASSMTYRDRLANPHTGTTQFYLDGSGTLELPAGEYSVRAFKGTEYEVAKAEVTVRAGEDTSAELVLRRWIDPPASGWYGADDHIHVARLSPEQDAWVASWMQAEGLQVANLLQMGTQVQFGVTPQYAFGDAGAYRSDGTLLLAGQEHPRTHFLGHTITLGAQEPIDARDGYIVYENFWSAAGRLGGVFGFAHWGLGVGTDGLAVNAPSGQVRFIELLQFEFPHYDVWYELLNLGIPIAPTAGTDFPCLASVPGRERFYAKVEGTLGRAPFVEAIRQGRTFVTNGPVLEFSVDGADIGDELLLAEPGEVRVRGSVRFDPTRDRVELVEVVRNGSVVAAENRAVESGRFEIEVPLPVERSAWFALRVSGSKLDEAPYLPLEVPEWAVGMVRNYMDGASLDERTEYARMLESRPSAAHTGAIWVRVEAGGSPDTGRPALAQKWLDRLERLETRLEENRLEESGIWDWIPYSDGVSVAHLRQNRTALLEAIARARTYYRAQTVGR